MIEGLRPYPDMTHTGVAWLSSTPRDWQTLRAKYVFREVDRRSQDGQETHLSMHQKLGLVPSADTGEKRLVSESYAGGKLVEPNDLVLNRLKAHLGVFAYATRPGVISPDYTVLRPLPNANVRYYEYLLKSPACRGELRTRTKGIVEGFWRLYTDDFYDIRLPVPTLDEQRLIVRFLDWHGAMTGKLIRAKRRLIALLNEQKQSIIHRAVTRGLDPTAMLKPSGNPLIGDVVDGWAIRRLRNVAELRVSNVDKKVHEGELPVRLCNYVDVYRNEDVGPNIPFMEATATPFEIERFRLKIGDVLVTKDSEDWKDIGVPALVATEADDLVCAYHLAMLRPFADEIEGGFLFWQLMGWAARWSFAMQASGVTRFGLSQGAIKALQLVVPPLDEQKRIVAHLVEATADIRRGVQDAMDEIALIQEFRTRLIADVVTGQIDVRTAAASLPEVAENEAFTDAPDDMDDEDEDALDVEAEDA